MEHFLESFEKVLAVVPDHVDDLSVEVDGRVGDLEVLQVKLVVEEVLQGVLFRVELALVDLKHVPEAPIDLVYIVEDVHICDLF